MDPITQQTTLAAAGGKKDPLYVDDVFSTFLYEGNNTTGRNIPNGIDLAGEGGLVWVKKRSASEDHVLLDTERGENNFVTITNNAAVTSGGPITAFRSDGFTVDNNGYVNSNSTDYVSWTFRKAPGFFDVVTYTGTGSARTVAHNLGSVPGMIICKPTSTTGVWRVYHQNVGNDKELVLSSTQAQSGSSAWNDTTPTSTEFTVNNNDVNASGVSYVAYLFAHDDASFGTDGDESIIKCGTYNGSGTSGTQPIDIGFEPQFLIVKCSSSGAGDAGWMMFDVMQDFYGYSSNDSYSLRADSTDQLGATNRIHVTTNGFGFNGEGAYRVNASGETYVYMAIRRPNKPPEAGTDVFNAKLRTGTGTTGQIDSGIGFAPDLAIIKSRNVGTSGFFYDRLRGDDNYLQSSSIDQESSGGLSLTSATGTVVIGGSAGWHSENGRTFVDLYFKRAPGFMDIVAYTGTGVIRTVAHNLEAVPELIIVKKRDTANADWPVYSVAAGSNSKAFLNLNDATTVTSDAYWGSTTPTSSVFTVGAGTLTNGGGADFIAYLFATLPGISKVGTYTGTGSTINVDCGFTAGARFVLTKRTDFATDWVFYDTARGIVSGNDPALTINANDADYTTYDFIDPLNSGFTLNASGFSNQSGGNYIFLAIA